MTTTENIRNFMETKSGFGFEMEVVRKFRSLNFSVYHSGMYADPVTGVFRQFDAYAQMEVNNDKLVLQVECKRVGADYPVIVACSQRSERESSHCLFQNTGPDSYMRMVRNSGLYPKNEMVGRSFDQWTTDKKPKAADDVWFKFSQAVQASIAQTSSIRMLNESDETRRKVALIPCVVVPDGTLWKIDYDEDGAIENEPQRVDHLSYFIGLPSSHQPTQSHPLTHFTITHMEVMTLSGIEKLFKDHLERERTWKHIFA